MLWCPGAQNIGLSNRKHYEVHRIITTHAHPSYLLTLGFDDGREKEFISRC